MELPDEVRDLLGAAEDTVVGGKDLLYGWLVGRAAADLGLAQVLARTEAQHSDKIKRLEENLLGQIRELSKSGQLTEESASVEVDALKAELQRVSDCQRQLSAQHTNIEQLEALVGGKLREFEAALQRQPDSGAGGDLADITFELKLLADRVARMEYAAQQAQAQAERQSQRIGELVADALKSETAQLKSQLAAEGLNDSTVATMRQSLEVSLTRQLDDLRAELAPAARVAADLGGLQDHLAELSQRLGQTEMAAGQQATLVDHGKRSTQELDARMDRLEQALLAGTADLRAEIDGMRHQVGEALAGRTGDDLRIRRLEESVTLRIGALQDKLAEALGVMERHQVQMNGIHDQLRAVAGQLTGLTDHAEENAARTRDLETRLNEQTKGQESGAVDLAPLQRDMSILLERITELESSLQQAQASSGAATQQAQQVAVTLGADLAALRAELGEQAAITVPKLMANVEENFTIKINELQNCLTNALRADQERPLRLDEVRQEIHVIAGRLLQTESTSQQTHALVLQEAQQTAQLRDDVLQELAELRGQLAERSGSDSGIDTWGEALSARIDDLQNRLSRSLAAGESRDAEIAELGARIDQLSQVASLRPAQTAPAAQRFQPNSGAAVGVNAVKTPPDLPRQPVSGAAGEAGSLLQSFEAFGDGSREQKRQLQQRISADIERVRAELRKRAGVSR